MSDDILAQRLRQARTFLDPSLPGQAILAMGGDLETHHFILDVAELARLARQLTCDATLLTAEPMNSRREAAFPSAGLSGPMDPKTPS